jgi:enabled protein
VAFIWLRLIRGLPPWFQELHPDIPASPHVKLKITKLNERRKKAELMLQQAEDETRGREEEDAKIREAEDYKRKVESKRKQRKIRDEIDLQRLSGAIMRQQLNDVTVDDQAVPTRASSVVSGFWRVRRVSSHPSISNNSTFLAQTPAAFTQASTMATTAPIIRTMANPRTQPNTVVISTAAQTQAMTTPLVGSVARMPTPTRLFSQPAATVPSTPKVTISADYLKLSRPAHLHVPHPCRIFP